MAWGKAWQGCVYVCTPSSRAAVSLVIMWKLSLGWGACSLLFCCYVWQSLWMVWQSDWMLWMVWHILCLLHGTTWRSRNLSGCLLGFAALQDASYPPRA